VKVKALEVDPEGRRIRLSRKAVLLDDPNYDPNTDPLAPPPGEREAEPPRSDRPGGSSGDRGGRSDRGGGRGGRPPGRGGRSGGRGRPGR